MSSESNKFIFDRGRAQYFHGREDVLNAFQGLLKTAKQEQEGAIFLVQGSPGAGKTALLHKCSRLAKKAAWEVVKIKIPYFWDLDSFKKEMKQSKEEPKIKKDLSQFVPSKGTLNVGVPYIGASIDFDFQETKTYDFLNSGQKPLVLVLDEAQNLNDAHASEHKKEIVKNILDSVENGHFHRPIILLLGGLNHTFSAIQSLNVYRLKDGCTHFIGPLDKEAEKKIIRDWLVKDGQAQGDVNPWVEAMALETSQWPQHIMSYIRIAVPYLIENDGKLSDKGLNHVLTEGRKKKAEFYERRSHLLLSKERKNLARLFSSYKATDSIPYEKIIDSLKKDFSEEKSEKIFNIAIEKGLISQKKGDFIIPIPSMHAWLVSHYDGIEETMNKQPSIVQKTMSQTIQEELPSTKKRGASATKRLSKGQKQSKAALGRHTKGGLKKGPSL